MVDVDKLDAAINELESSSKTILKLADFVKDTEKLVDRTKENYMILDRLVEVINEAKDNSILSSQLCEKAYKTVDDYCMKSNEANASFISRVNTLLLEMKNENASLYKNFETSLISKFNLFKSDIVIENRKIVKDTSGIINEKMDLAKIDINNNVKQNIDEVIARLNEKIDSKSKILIILVCSAIVILIGGLVMQFIR